MPFILSGMASLAFIFGPQFLAFKCFLFPESRRESYCLVFSAGVISAIASTIKVLITTVLLSVYGDIGLEIARIINIADCLGIFFFFLTRSVLSVDKRTRVLAVAIGWSTIQCFTSHCIPLLMSCWNGALSNRSLQRCILASLDFARILGIGVAIQPVARYWKTSKLASNKSLKQQQPTTLWLAIAIGIFLSLAPSLISVLFPIKQFPKNDIDFVMLNEEPHLLISWTSCTVQGLLALITLYVCRPILLTSIS